MKAATGVYDDNCAVLEISIHAAREGGDSNRKEVLRGSEISIHAAREGGDKNRADIIRDFTISIHAAREGGDCNVF